MRVGVVGHVEVVEFALADRVPGPGEIAHAPSSFVVPAGGGGVAAVVLAGLAGACSFWTALGDDDAGRFAVADLTSRGVDLRVEWWAGVPTRRGFCHLTDDGERTITVIGERLAPDVADLDTLDGVYVTAASAQLLHQVRERARVLVATPRVGTALARSGVTVDVLVGSDADPGEDLSGAGLAPPRAIVRTRGADGGVWSTADGATGEWSPTPVHGEVRDAYGCGDAFAAALTHELAAGHALPDACARAAEAGAHRLTLRGPFG